MRLNRPMAACKVLRRGNVGRRSLLLLAAVAVATFVAAQAATAATPLVNGSFETGSPLPGNPNFTSLDGWTAGIPVGGYAGGATSFVEDLPAFVFGGVVILPPKHVEFYPVDGNRFALLKTDGHNSYTTVSQTFVLDGPATISGWVFFNTRDGYRPPTRNDHAEVYVYRNGVLVATPFYADTNLVGDRGYTPWTYWTYTVPSAGEYRVLAGVTNTGDETQDSHLGLDAVRVNRPPQANDDAYSVAEDGLLTLSAPGVLGNDVDPDGDALTAALVGGPAAGTLTLDTDGAFQYQPAPDFHGVVTFTYTASDGEYVSNQATVTITVDPVNDAPVAVAPAPVNLLEGASVVIDLDPLVADLETPDGGIAWSGASDNPAGVTVAVDQTLRQATIVGLAGDAAAVVTLTATDGGDPDGCAGGPPACSAPLSAAIPVPVVVLNVIPAVTLTGGATIIEGDTFASAGSFADPGADAWTGTVDYDDGLGPQALALAPDKTFGLSHVYPVAGVYSVTVGVDDGQDVGIASLVVTVERVADDTPPVVTPAVAGTLGGNGWYVSDVTVSWAVEDPESDVVSTFGCEPAAVTADTAGATFTCEATSDGGTGSASLTIMRDATAPTIVAAASPEPNGNGWNNTDVTVSYLATDATSGIDAGAGDLADDVLAVEGAGQGASGTAVDLAGNVAVAEVAGINIDKTAPAIVAAASPEPNGNGWNKTDVTVSYAASDATSGIDAGASDLADDVLAVEGAGQGASGTAVDLAGNVAVAEVTGINIDKTAPFGTLTTPGQGAVHKLLASVLAEWTVGDALSGIDSIVATGPTGEPIDTGTPGAKSFAVSATDRAGNVAQVAHTYSVAGLMEQKRLVIASLAPYKDSVKGIGKAIAEIEKSLDPGLWLDETHLDPKHGQKVFARERDAVKELLGVVKKGRKGGVSAEAVAAAQAAIGQLVTIDRTLAQIAVDEVQGVQAVQPKLQKRVDREVARAAEALAQGDAHQGAGKLDKAIQEYRSAWEHATHAAAQAAKTRGGDGDDRDDDRDGEDGEDGEDD